ncbi:MAG TPA: hypothetical protein VM031_06215 [Phycisphaerae bacterium]|nr:hypothetical protein [Phycisphaerae bacterium]
MPSALRSTGYRRLGVAIAAAMLLLVSARSAAGEEGRTVHYQVTYADGSSRDLSAVPQTNKGIARVLRISRIEQGLKGYEIMSTGPQTLTLVSRGQTYRTDLVWNGKAWVAPAGERKARVLIAPPQSAGPADGAQAETLRLKAALMELAAKLLDSNERLSAAAKALDGNTPAAAAVAKARQEIRSCVRTVVDGARRLSPAKGAAKPPVDPTGKVTTLGTASPAKGAGGIATPIGKVASLSHRVQVWEAPPGRGERTYQVSIAHPEGGASGGFYYVAYADADGDGRPDRLLARSPFAQAERAGQWTQWGFATKHGRVFVGKAWDRADTVHYHAESVRIDDNWRGLSDQVYVSVEPWGLPVRRWGRCVGNIRVWVGGR